MKTLTLESPTLTATFCSDSGTLVGLTSTITGWSVLSKPELGLSFSLQVPLPGKRANFVTGADNPPSAVEPAADGRSITFTWKNLRSPHAKGLDITLTGTVRVEGDGL